MPGGDGTGPMGMGPMTGRAAGRCTGDLVPGRALGDIQRRIEDLESRAAD